MKNVKKFITVLAVFSFASIGITYAASTSPDSITSFFLGNGSISGSSMNEVLALLVGPKGDVGPAGVAGKDGFVGMNGQDGANGLDGAPGPVGPQGPAGADGKDGTNGKDGINGTSGGAGANGKDVLMVALGTGDANCPQGGTQFTSGAGVVSYACNGTGGSGGQTQGNGTPQGQGLAGFTSCTGATTIGIGYSQAFTGTGFRFSTVDISNLPTLCNSNNVAIYFSIKPTGTLFGTVGKYANGNAIKCVKNIPSGFTSPSVFSFYGNDACTNTTNNTTLLLSDISTQDSAEDSNNRSAIGIAISTGTL
jgi:hypothetical protein